MWVWQNGYRTVTQQSEIEALRAQLESLERRSREKSPSPSKAESTAESSEASPAEFESLEHLQKWADQFQLAELSEKLSEYLAGLGQDVKDSKPRALVSAFVAGFLAGKVMSR